MKVALDWEMGYMDSPVLASHEMWEFGQST